MDFGIAIHIDDFVNVLQKFLSTFQIKKLCLDIRYDQFMALSTLPASSSFTELDIVLAIYSPDPINETNGGLAPHLFSRLRSVTFKRPDFAIDLFDRLFVSSLPWSQLQSLKFFVYNDNPRCFVDILRQIPMLQVLHFSLCRGLLDGLTMPALWDIFIKVDSLNGTAVDNVLRSFTCPVLTKFTLKTFARWTSEHTGLSSSSIISKDFKKSTFSRVPHCRFLLFYRMRPCRTHFHLKEMVSWII